MVDFSVTENIEKRISCRTYDGRQLSSEHKNALLAVSNNLPAAPFGNDIQIALLELDEDGLHQGQKLGTYGLISGAKTYIAGAVKNNDRAIIDFGFIFEYILLHATALNLATCWLGGSVKRDDFRNALNLNDGDVIPAVSPVGYSASKRSFRDSAIRFLAASKKRKPWQELFFINNFDTALSEQNAGKYATVLEMVRLAPSASNKQPWRIVRDEEKNCFHLFKKRFNYGKMAGIDIQYIDMGIAMCHFENTAVECKATGGWENQKPEHYPSDDVEYIMSWMITK